MSLFNRVASWASDTFSRLISIKEVGRLESLYSTKFGNYWIPNRPWSDTISRRIGASRIFGEEILELCKKHYIPGTAILDVGANLGQMSIVLARYCSDVTSKNRDVHPPKFFVYSFEAQPRIAALLKRNIDENDLSARIFVVSEPVWDTRGIHLTFPQPNPKLFSNWGSNGVSQADEEAESLVSTTIDAIEIEDNISVIKIDVQGADYRALLGARHLIDRCKPAILFEYEHEQSLRIGASLDAYLDFLHEMNYKLVWSKGDDYLALPANQMEPRP